MIEDAPQHAADPAGELHASSCSSRCARARSTCAILADPFSGPGPGHAGGLRRAVHGRGAAPASRGPTREDIGSEELKARDHAAAGHRPLLPRPGARGLPGARRAIRRRSAGIQKTFEGSSLETIRHMVASGIGITVLPMMATPRADRRRPACLRAVRAARRRCAGCRSSGARAFPAWRRSRRCRQAHPAVQPCRRHQTGREAPVAALSQRCLPGRTSIKAIPEQPE